eukprot:CAMPEP_0119310046 /NCGR_PEP_ID=MMETSP1333-20130426/17671_1 /TAXON_ID=418940 /ORGANISM="Scyphosphaera apsteinii, Strain RCC1455" /LENGTH=512 /DNA_ID=CAMNT_0007314163 /DNA_START=26 /DNA_END=1564 /DNA_ORIENTATION=-
MNPVLAIAAVATAPSPQHVLTVVIDDLGYDDLGFRNNGQILTPNFNQLHAYGVDLARYYVQPSCSPTRAAILTGRKPLHTGINFWLPNIAAGLALNEVTLADVLNKRNFTSHAVGKWHLGFHKTAYTPTFRGFSSFYGYYEGSEDYFSHETSGGFDFHDEPRMFCGPGCTQRPWHLQGQYSTNLFAARAVDIVNEHSLDTNLFMYLAFQGVHFPRQAPQNYVEPYTTTISDPHRRTFAGMIAALDEGLGNVTAALKARGMFDSTLIIVTTDNGGPTTECSTTGQSNWPFRGSKCSLWEGGTRGTAFVYWAGLPPSVRGGTFYGLAHAADLLPTIVIAVGGRLWPNETRPLDGVSLWTSLISNNTSPRTSVYYGISQSHEGPAVRDADGFKLIASGSGGGKGAWSPQQLPNASSSCKVNDTYNQLSLIEGGAGKSLVGADSEGLLLYYLPSDASERSPLDPAKNADVVARLQELIESYDKTKVPQVTGDPACPTFTPLDSKEGKWIGPWCDGV